MNKRVRRKKAKKNLVENPLLAKKPRGLSARKGLNMKIGADGSMHIRHMADTDKCLALLPGIPVNTELDVTMSDDKKLVWNKLATHGTFLGHPTGPFAMNHDTFKQVETNFKRDGIDVVFDYEHAAEMSVTESPLKGKGEVVASGWIKDIQARPDGLYGLVDWTDSARSKIKSGEMKYISPAIRFGAKDGKTGEVVGAKLTSSALTLKPFLKDLPPALASDSEYTAFLCSEISTEDIESAGSSGYAMSANQFLPEFRRILKMDDTSSPDEMADKVDRLQDLCEMADGDPSAVVQGVNLNNYIQPLRDFMRMPANTTLDDMLCAVNEMICSTIDSEGAEMSDIVSTDAPQTAEQPVPVLINNKETENIMDPNTITLADHAVKLSDAVKSAVETATAPLSLQLKDAEARAAKALADKAEVDAKVLELSEQIKKRDADLITSRVEDAFETYKETKKLSEDDKAAMPIVLSTNPELFEKLYPKVAPAKALMLRTVLSSDTSAATRAASAKVVPPLADIVSDIQSKHPTKSYDEVFTMALKEQTVLMAG